MLVIGAKMKNAVDMTHNIFKWQTLVSQIQFSMKSNQINLYCRVFKPSLRNSDDENLKECNVMIVVYPFHILAHTPTTKCCYYEMLC